MFKFSSTDDGIARFKILKSLLSILGEISFSRMHGISAYERLSDGKNGSSRRQF